MSRTGSAGAADPAAEPFPSPGSDDSASVAALALVTFVPADLLRVGHVRAARAVLLFHGEFTFGHGW